MQLSSSSNKRARLDDDDTDTLDIETTPFDRFRLSDETKELLKERKITSLFPIQAKTFDVIYDKSDLVARARTGTGKTLGFVLPVMERLKRDYVRDAPAPRRFRPPGTVPRVLVLVPTRELALQVYRDFESVGGPLVRSLAVYGGTSIVQHLDLLKPRAPGTGSPQLNFDDQWACSACRRHNFASRTTCRQCGAAKTDKCRAVPKGSPQSSPRGQRADVQVSSAPGTDGLVDIVVATPGRALDLLARGALRLAGTQQEYEEAHSLRRFGRSAPKPRDGNTPPSARYLEAVILDEADRMLDLGFTEDVEKILAAVTDPTAAMQPAAEGEERDPLLPATEPSEAPLPQILLFSATVPAWVRKIGTRWTQRRGTDTVRSIDLVGSEVATSLKTDHYAISVHYQHRTATLADVLKVYAGSRGRTIVFTDTKSEANELALNSQLQPLCQVLHGDISQHQRETTLESFRQNNFRCLVATDVAARGLDIPKVDLIVLCHAPRDYDTFIHRSGRTGRAGRRGVCIVFYSYREKGHLEQIERHCNIKFTHIGAPQPPQILRAGARDASQALASVAEELTPFFLPVAGEIVQEALPASPEPVPVPVEGKEAEEEAEKEEEEEEEDDRSHKRRRKDQDGKGKGKGKKKKEKKKKMDGKKYAVEADEEEEEAEGNEDDQDPDSDADAMDVASLRAELAATRQRADAATALLARSLAFISGHTEPPQTRSLLTSIEGVTSMLFERVLTPPGRYRTKSRAEASIRSAGYVWSTLRAHLTEEDMAQVKTLRLCQDRLYAVFDLPTGPVVQRAVRAFASDPWSKVSVAESLPELAVGSGGPQDSPRGGRGGRGRSQGSWGRGGRHDEFGTQGNWGRGGRGGDRGGEGRGGRHDEFGTQAQWGAQRRGRGRGRGAGRGAGAGRGGPGRGAPSWNDGGNAHGVAFANANGGASNHTRFAGQKRTFEE